MTQHYCKGKWEDGTVSACAKHEQNRNRQAVRMGLNARRKADKKAGVVGKDVGTGVYGDPT